MNWEESSGESVLGRLSFCHVASVLNAVEINADINDDIIGCVSGLLLETHCWRQTKLDRTPSTGSSKIKGAKFCDACSVKANWLCMGWPFFLAEMRREFQTGGKFFCTTLYLHFAVVKSQNFYVSWGAIQ